MNSNKIVQTKREDYLYTREEKHPINAFSFNMFPELVQGQILYSIVIPDGVVTLNNRTFAYARIQNIQMPDSLLNIEDECFLGTQFNVDHLVLPPNLQYIGKRAFNGAKGSGLLIPNGVRVLRRATFMNSRFLYISCTGVIRVGSFCFSGLNHGDRKCQILFDDLKVLKDYAFNYSNIDVTLPNELEYIGRSCFIKSKLSADISETSLLWLTVCAFAFSNLTRVKIPDGVIVVGDCCFANCVLLESVSFPESLLVLGKYCFYRCFSLDRVDLPASLRKIGDFCFFYCKNLNTVYHGRRHLHFDLMGVVDDNLGDVLFEAVGQNRPDYLFDRALYRTVVVRYKDTASGRIPNLDVGDYAFDFTNLVENYTCDDMIRDSIGSHFYWNFNGNNRFYTGLLNPEFDLEKEPEVCMEDIKEDELPSYWTETNYTLSNYNQWDANLIASDIDAVVYNKNRMVKPYKDVVLAEELPPGRVLSTLDKIMECFTAYPFQDGDFYSDDEEEEEEGEYDGDDEKEYI